MCAILYVRAYVCVCRRERERERESLLSARMIFSLVPFFVLLENGYYIYKCITISRGTKDKVCVFHLYSIPPLCAFSCVCVRVLYINELAKGAHTLFSKYKERNFLDEHSIQTCVLKQKHVSKLFEHTSFWEKLNGMK